MVDTLTIKNIIRFNFISWGCAWGCAPTRRKAITCAELGAMTKQPLAQVIALRRVGAQPQVIAPRRVGAQPQA